MRPSADDRRARCGAAGSGVETTPINAWSLALKPIVVVLQRWSALD
jgi:hypothetical protein